MLCKSLVYNLTVKKKDDITDDLFPALPVTITDNSNRDYSRVKQSLDDILLELQDVINVAVYQERPQCAAAVSAIKLKAELLGLTDKKIENDNEKEEVFFYIPNNNR